MQYYTIRTMDLGEIKLFYQYIKQDFPAGEYPPYEILHGHLREGRQEGLVLYSGQQAVAYAVCAASTGYVLLSLFAVLPEFRGRGAGTEFLNALRDKYIHKQAIVGEVERPELVSNAEELKKREERMRFYEKAGYYLIPGIDYTIWDVPMHLMVLPIKADEKTINENIQTIMYQIYLQLMGKAYMHKMILK